jgi:hypothetical protein
MRRLTATLLVATALDNSCTEVPREGKPQWQDSYMPTARLDPIVGCDWLIRIQVDG